MDAPQQTILLVEDEPLLRQSLNDVLVQAGYKVLLASDGKQGLDVALKEHPTLILTDHLMPVMSGVDMVAQLREDDWGKDAVVMLMTNMYDGDTLNKSLTVGVTDYVMKADVTVDKVVQLVQNRLKATGR
jgi:DNA-binding response OmpR family regulator